MGAYGSPDVAIAGMVVDFIMILSPAQKEDIDLVPAFGLLIRRYAMPSPEIATATPQC